MQVQQIIISTENKNRGSWIKIFLPQKFTQSSMAVLTNLQGSVIKTVELEEGNNAIDASNINETDISVKVQTQYQTIVKQVKLQ